MRTLATAFVTLHLGGMPQYTGASTIICFQSERHGGGPYTRHAYVRQAPVCTIPVYGVSATRCSAVHVQTRMIPGDEQGWLFYLARGMKIDDAPCSKPTSDSTATPRPVASRQRTAPRTTNNKRMEKRRLLRGNTPNLRADPTEGESRFSGVNSGRTQGRQSLLGS